MQDHSSNIPPVRTFTLRLQKADVRDDMLFVIGRQHRFIRSNICNVGV